MSTALPPSARDRADDEPPVYCRSRREPARGWSIDVADFALGAVAGVFATCCVFYILLWGVAL